MASRSPRKSVHKSEGHYCGVTGEVNCKCDHKSGHKTAMQVDLKATMRILWTAHAVYTKFVINGLVDGSGDVDVNAARVLQNQKDIGDQLKPIIGEGNGVELTRLLQTHIKLAKTVATDAVNNSSQLNNDINKFLNNGDEISEFLERLNPKKLPFDAVSEMFLHHNQQVIDMTTLRIKGQHKEEQRLYDAYFNHMMEMSDAITDAVM